MCIVSRNLLNKKELSLFIGRIAFLKKIIKFTNFGIKLSLTFNLKIHGYN